LRKGSDPLNAEEKEKMAKLSFELFKDKDTRDNSDLLVLKIKEQVKDFQALRSKLKGWYYSKFKKGFITKDLNITDNDVKKMLEGQEVAEIKKTSKNESPEYFKKLSDYITLEEGKEKIKELFLNLSFSQYKHWAQNANIWDVVMSDEEKTKVLNFMLDYFVNYVYNKNYDLKYIRECIIHKSLKKDFNTFHANGDDLTYFVIWDKLPIIEGLETTKEFYSATWGYDQTNVTLAYKLNKKCWGLTVFETNSTSNKYLLKRIAENAKNFSNSFMYFTKCDNPDSEYYMQHDASRTGNYR
jgi:hypothetical protein